MKRVLVAAEGPAGPRLADAAAELAQTTGADVTVVSVDDVESQRFEMDPRSELRERAEQRAAEVVERLAAAGVQAAVEVRQGTAVETILEVAEEQDADVIVVGPSGRAQLAERLLGSLPLELIQRSQRQVLVVTNGG